MNALDLLSQDHKKVKGLFEQAEKADEKQQKKIFDQIKQELETHTRIEETVFYPAMQEHGCGLLVHSCGSSNQNTT